MQTEDVIPAMEMWTLVFSVKRLIIGLLRYFTMGDVTGRVHVVVQAL